MAAHAQAQLNGSTCWPVCWRFKAAKMASIVYKQKTRHPRQTARVPKAFSHVNSHATPACCLYGGHIIPRSRWGVGLKPGMRTISQQEAERRGPPSPHAQMSPWPVQSAVSTTPKETKEFSKRKPTKQHRHMHFFLLAFLLKTFFFIFDMSYSYIIKKHYVTKILKGTFFF